MGSKSKIVLSLCIDVLSQHNVVVQVFHDNKLTNLFRIHQQSSMCWRIDKYICVWICNILRLYVVQDLRNDLQVGQPSKMGLLNWVLISAFTIAKIIAAVRLVNHLRY